MVSRILPVREWSKVTDPETVALLPALFDHQEHVTILVVEDGEKVVSSWVMIQVPQLEGIYVDPDYRGQSAVVFKMLALMKRTARAKGFLRVTTTSVNQEIGAMCKAIGGEQLPGSHWVLPVGE